MKVRIGGKRTNLVCWAQVLALLTSTALLNNASAKEQSMSHSTSDQVVTHCVGRYLVDLPAQVYFRAGRFSYAYSEIEIETKSQDGFLEEVSVAEKKMAGLTHAGNSPLLVKSLRPADDSRILAYWKHETSREAIVDGYRWLNGKRYLFRRIVSGPKIEEGTAWMTNFITRVRARDGNIPTVRGFCIPDAIILDDGRTYPESVDSYFEFKDKKDITLDISTTVNEGNPPETLLSRKPGVMSALGTLGATLGGMRTIKEGDRKVGDMAGQQWLISAPNDRGHRAHLFTWETPGDRRAKLRPQVRIDLESAKYGQGVEPGPASLNDKDMLELWESILGTLRLRPTDDEGSTSPDAKPAPRTGAAQPLPLGELAATGVACPQTGYWQCPEPDVRGSTRLFQQGVAMPAATVRRDLSLIERLKGTNAEISTNTVWRLVRYDESSVTSLATSLASGGADQSSSDA